MPIYSCSHTTGKRNFCWAQWSHRVSGHPVSTRKPHRTREYAHIGWCRRRPTIVFAECRSRSNQKRGATCVGTRSGKSPSNGLLLFSKRPVCIIYISNLKEGKSVSCTRSVLIMEKISERNFSPCKRNREVLRSGFVISNQVFLDGIVMFGLKVRKSILKEVLKRSKEPETRQLALFWFFWPLQLFLELRRSFSETSRLVFSRVLFARCCDGRTWETASFRTATIRGAFVPAKPGWRTLGLPPSSCWRQSFLLTNCRWGWVLLSASSFKSLSNRWVRREALFRRSLHLCWLTTATQWAGQTAPGQAHELSRQT